MTKMIDIHPHIISTDTVKYPITPLGGKRSEWSATRPATFEQLIEGMDKGGVTHAAIVHSSTTYGFDNSYCADMVSTNLKRFTGVGSVDLLAADAVEKVRYWHGRNITGLRLFTAGSTMDKQANTLSDPKSFPAWEAAGALGMTMCVQMRREGLPQLMDLIKQFPKIRILIDHLVRAPIEDGVPYTDCQFLWDLKKYDNVYLKLSTNNVRSSRKGKGTPETFFPLLVKNFGASRIAWGSNFPASAGTLPQIADEARSALACLSQADQDSIFYKTAELLYPALA